VLPAYPSPREVGRVAAAFLEVEEPHDALRRGGAAAGLGPAVERRGYAPARDLMAYRIDITHDLPDAPRWTADRTRRLSKAEECLIFTDPSSPPTPLAAARLVQTDTYWAVEPAVSFYDTQHGAAVASREDGAVIGILLVDDGHGRIAPVPDSFIKPAE